MLRGISPTDLSSVSHACSHTGGRRGSEGTAGLEHLPGAGTMLVGPRSLLSADGAKPTTAAAAHRVCDGQRRTTNPCSHLVPHSRSPFSVPSLTSMAPGRSRRGPARGGLRQVPAVVLAPAQPPPHPARPLPLASALGARPISACTAASCLPAQRERLCSPRGDSRPANKGLRCDWPRPAGAQPMGKQLARASRQ